MAKEPPAAPAPPLVDDPAAPEIFVDGMAGLAYRNGNFHLTLSRARADFSRDPAAGSRVAALRLILPLASLLTIQDQLARAVAEMEARQLFQRADPPDGSATIH